MNDHNFSAGRLFLVSATELCTILEKKAEYFN